MIEKTKIKKRKVGRPKKRGPKKKRKYISKKPKIDRRTLISHRVYYDFKIVTCHNNKKNGVIGKYKTLSEAYSALNELESKNKEIIFKRKTTSQEKIKESIDEYILLEENRDGNKKNFDLRNKYGIFSKVYSNITDWIIVDKREKYVEETFTVFGYDPKRDRKTFLWIFDNLISNVDRDNYEYKKIILYKNKIVIKNSNRDLDVVFCKNISDAVRFYNLVSTFVKDKKIKNVYMYGSYSDISEKRSKLEKELSDFTGYSIKKIQNSRNTRKGNG